jgi:hypothetical protein
MSLVPHNDSNSVDFILVKNIVTVYISFSVSIKLLNATFLFVKQKIFQEQLQE